jgi:MscS family membrane protein
MRTIAPPSAHWLLVLALMWMVSRFAHAADKPYPLESADTSSPRATLKSFLRAMHDVYEVARNEGRSYDSEAERAAARDRVLRCLDLSELPPAVRTSLAREAAVCLKEVLDRIELPAETDWPDSDQVADMEISKWTIPHTEILIVKM